MVERRVVADFGRFADDNAHPVIDEHAAADRGPRVDLDAGQEAAPVREPAREPAEIGTPYGMNQRAMPDERVQAGIAGEHFPRAARGRVALEHHPDVFAESAEHSRIMPVSE